MESVSENVKAKFQKIEDDRELEKISGGRSIFGVYLGWGREELINYVKNPNGYSLDEGKWVLIDEQMNGDKLDYTVIGSYDSKEERDNAANELKSKDPHTKYLRLGIYGEYGMLELIALNTNLLSPRHHY